MTMLEQITKGKESKPPRILVYGENGIGKSSFAAQAPNAVFIQTENGLGEIECAKFPLAQTYDDVLNAIGVLYKENHNYQTLVIDTLDWLEQLIWARVCEKFNVTCIEKADGGYAKGYTHALHYWRQIKEGLDALREQRGMSIIQLAHAKVEKFDDPESLSYDRYSPRLHKLAAALLCDWNDAVLFATRKFRTQSEDAGFNRTRTIAVPVGKDGGDRILRTVVSPACIAKNRYGFDPEFPLSWEAVQAGIVQHMQS